MRVSIARAAADRIAAETAAVSDREVCGLLLGDGAAINHATRCANIAADPSRTFEIDPAALFAAIHAERAGGERLMGYWHSHPNGDATPSATDADQAAPDGQLWIIAGGGELTAWRAGKSGRHGRFEEVKLRIV